MMLSMETRGRAIKVVIVSQSDFNSQCHLLEMHSVLQYPCFDILLFFFFFFLVENILLKPIQYPILEAHIRALILNLLLTKTLFVTTESQVWQCVHIKQTARRQTLKIAFTYPVRLHMNKSFHRVLPFCTLYPSSYYYFIVGINSKIVVLHASSLLSDIECFCK